MDFACERCNIDLIPLSTEYDQNIVNVSLCRKCYDAIDYDIAIRTEAKNIASQIDRYCKDFCPAKKCLECPLLGVTMKIEEALK